MNSKFKGGVSFAIGYLLSPLSWWNDIVINIPLAYVFALPFGLISKNLFLPAMVLGYWITNVSGFLLLHLGVTDLVSRKRNSSTKKAWIKSIVISLIYTLLIIILIKLGWLRLPEEYFG